MITRSRRRSNNNTNIITTVIHKIVSFMIGPEYESWDHTLQTIYITHLELQHEGTHVPYHIQHNSTRAWLGWIHYRASNILRNTNMVILAFPPIRRHIWSFRSHFSTLISRYRLYSYDDMVGTHHQMDDQAVILPTTPPPPTGRHIYYTFLYYQLPYTQSHTFSTCRHTTTRHRLSDSTTEHSWNNSNCNTRRTRPTLGHRVLLRWNAPSGLPSSNYEPTTTYSNSTHDQYTCRCLHLSYITSNSETNTPHSCSTYITRIRVGFPLPPHIIWS